jgi:WD40 repeat protein
MNPVKIYDMEFMPDHNTFLVTTDFELQIRSTETGEILEIYPFGSQELEFTPDSTRLVTYNIDSIFIRNINDFSIVNYYSIPLSEEGWRYNIQAMQVDPIRPYIYFIRGICIEQGGDPRICYKRVLMLNYETMELEEDITPEGFEKRYCKKLAISRDGKYLAGVTESNSKIVIWDLDTRKVIQELQICPFDLPWDDHGNPTCVKFSQLDNDKIYISGIFPKGVNIPVFSGIYIYSVKSNSIIDSTFNIVKGYFDFFDNEERIIHSNGFSLFIINLEQKSVEYKGDLFDIVTPIIYSKVKDVCVGTDSRHISKISYERNSNINNQNDTTQKVYPNPTKSKVYINLEDKFEYTWQLFNFEGKLLIESKELNQKEIDLSNFPNGVYLLHLKYGDKEETIKIVKEG